MESKNTVKIDAKQKNNKKVKANLHCLRITALLETLYHKTENIL